MEAPPGAPPVPGAPLGGLAIALGAIPVGALVVLEGGASPAKAHVVREWATAAARLGRNVAFVDSRPGSVAPEGAHFVEAANWSEVPATPPGFDFAVDSFSMLSMDDAPQMLAARLRAIREACHRSASTAVLVLDDGQLGPAATSVCRHMADGVVQFLEREDAEGVLLVVRVPKWTDGKARERNIYYTFDGQRLLVDTRRRVN